MQPFCDWRTHIDQNYRARAGYWQGFDDQLPHGLLRGLTSAERQSAESAMDGNQAIEKDSAYDMQDNLIIWILPFPKQVGQELLHNILAILQLYDSNRQPWACS